jgi:hypothetical protein
MGSGGEPNARALRPGPLQSYGLKGCSASGSSGHVLNHKHRWLALVVVATANHL